MEDHALSTRVDAPMRPKSSRPSAVEYSDESTEAGPAYHLIWWPSSCKETARVRYLFPFVGPMPEGVSSPWLHITADFHAGHSPR